MQRNKSLIIKSVMFVGVIALMLLPASIYAQRRFVVVRPRRARVIVYQGPSVIYQPSYARPYYSYGYAQPYNGQYYNYGYPTPYYGSGYSYTYSQPHYANPYTTYQTYQTYPTYNYTYRTYRPRYRRSRVRLGIYLR